MQTLKGNIRVFCRVRPLGPADKASADRLESGRPVMVFPQPGGLKGPSTQAMPCQWDLNAPCKHPNTAARCDGMVRV